MTVAGPQIVGQIPTDPRLGVVVQTETHRTADRGVAVAGESEPRLTDH